MKKKGLIISTVVMVVVLIASLTTATYAWFTSQTVAKVGDIEMSATSANSLRIGANTKGVAGTGFGDYASGTVTWDTATSKWTGPAGLGPQIDFMSADAALSFALDKAVTVAKGTEMIDGTAAKAGSYIKANGEGSVVDTTTYANAEKNKDYFDATIFVVPVAKDTVKQAWCTITVKPTDDTKLGMAAAIRFSIKVGNNAAFTVDAYDGKLYSELWSPDDADVDAGKYDVATKTWTYDVELLAFNSAAYYGIDFASGVEIQITAWLEGTDDSCVSDNTGTGATISISFDSSKDEYTITNGVSTKKTTATP